MIYQDEALKELVFPLGGIGTGSIGLCGNGHLADWEIFNRPNKGSYNGYTHIAVRAELPDGRSVSRVLQGDRLKDLMGKYSKSIFSGYGYGPDVNTMAGFPHFEKVTFRAEFPFAVLTFRDKDFPAVVELTAFNPFIPNDSEASGIPGALFSVRIHAEETLRCTAAFVLKNPFEPSRNLPFEQGSFRGVFLTRGERPTDERTDPADDPDYGDLTLLLDDPDAFRQLCWYRGGWNDGVCTYWREFTEGRLRPRSYPTDGSGDTAVVAGSAGLAAGEEKTFRFALSWSCPTCRHYWPPTRDEAGKEITWKNYYASRFPDSRHSALCLLSRYEELFRRSDSFRNALFSSTLPPVVIEAASSNLSVLKSPTVLRLEDGSFYGWEGTNETEGSCEGTCSHVWSYAYALCFLFPDLERSIRRYEFTCSMKPSGGLVFRTKLPLGSDPGGFRPCVDGQMASIFKTYREWMLSGDEAWLRSLWPSLKKALAYTWSEENEDAWDRDRDGMLEGRQHHTLDMELFGPSSWLQGMYLCALSAMHKMALRLNDPDAALYASLFESGKRLTAERLFNGSHFIQQIDIRDDAPIRRFGCPEYWNEEAGEMKYQIAGGSEIDQLLGQWHADILGLGALFEEEQLTAALRYMFRHNFRPSLREIGNLWRNFALNDESGTIICHYREGEKPILAVPYSEECMTGFEYAFAGLLFSRGFRNEALEVVSAVRERYDGKKRNPFNEIECGNHYARSMASFALIPILSGFVFDLPEQTLGFRPRIAGAFRTIWSVSGCWGEFSLDHDSARLTILAGQLTLRRFLLPEDFRPAAVLIDGAEAPFTEEKGALCLSEPRLLRESLTVRRA